jgi:N-acetylneuraminate synthase
MSARRAGGAFPEIEIAARRVGREHPPLVVAEIGINHEGSVAKAHRMIDDAADAGCECVKFQCHVNDDEMVPAAREVVPANATESIWSIMSRCALDETAERELMAHAIARGMIFLSTPFSRAAADRLARLGVPAFKIGSGECSNLPLVRHIAAFGLPVVLSTGMHALDDVNAAVAILREAQVPFALLHCTSLYPTPYDRVRLGAIDELAAEFPDAVIGFSDHSIGNWCSLAAVGLGASILERHFTSDRSWPGPDISISMVPEELQDLVAGARAVHAARGGTKAVLPEEQPTRDFAVACVVSIRPIAAGETLSTANVWVKRPGTGAIPAARFDELLGRRAARDIPADVQLEWSDIA